MEGGDDKLIVAIDGFIGERSWLNDSAGSPRYDVTTTREAIRVIIWNVVIKVYTVLRVIEVIEVT